MPQVRSKRFQIPLKDFVSQISGHAYPPWGRSCAGCTTHSSPVTGHWGRVWVATGRIEPCKGPSAELGALSRACGFTVREASAGDGVCCSAERLQGRRLMAEARHRHCSSPGAEAIKSSKRAVSYPMRSNGRTHVAASTMQGVRVRHEGSEAGRGVPGVRFATIGV